MAIKVTWKNKSGKVESLTASTGTIRAAKVDSSDNPTEKFYYEHNPTARAQLTERADEADKLTTPSASRIKKKAKAASPVFQQQRNVVAPKWQSPIMQGLNAGALQQQNAKPYQSKEALEQHAKDVKPQTVTQRVGNAAKGVVDDAKHVVSAGRKALRGHSWGQQGFSMRSMQRWAKQ